MKYPTINDIDQINKRMQELQTAIDSIDNKIKYGLLSGSEMQSFIDDKKEFQREYNELKNKLFDLNQKGGSNEG